MWHQSNLKKLKKKILKKKKTFSKKKKAKKTASNIATIVIQVQGERDMWREQPSVTIELQI